jgi:ATP-dependent exoDNAse (exonuclease V) beta subunit
MPDPIRPALRQTMADLLPFPPIPVEIQLTESSGPPDAEARQQALDISRSFIVEAPAGSGKTGLLIQRFLKLLADDSVTSPEQVLAITFTNKATAELRNRVLQHLEAANLDFASSLTPSSSDFERQTRTLALDVLKRDQKLDWALLDHPHRLNIRTIDSVSAEIARTLPVLSGSGGRLTPATDADPLHREAARRTLLLLGSDDADFDNALRNLLLHRDGNLANCELLIADMLKLRDQWGDLIPILQPQLDDAWLNANVLLRLELTLDHAICASLNQLSQIFPAEVLTALTELASEFGSADGYKDGPSPLANCAGVQSPPEAIAAHMEHWLALIHLLTTSDGSWRKERGINGKNLRFEYDRKNHHHPQLTAIIDQLSDRDDLLLAFDNIRALPPAHYPEDQWAVAKSLFRALSRALVELQLVFAQHNQCDFTELSLLARHALGQDSGAEDLAAALGARLQHLLVDEMQDTSTGQYELLQLLTASWDGYSQTVFLVGDPRQSIYLFRQARVERFIRAMHTERLGELPLTRLRLTANFRSQRDLVNQFNDDFNLIFPTQANDPHALPYTPAQPTIAGSFNARGAVWHANPRPAPAATTTPAHIRRQQASCDASEIRSIARHWLSQPPPPGRTQPRSIAVLVRTRNHLTEIVAALRQEDGAGAIPFRAVDIEALGERQEILDLTALTRALLHPADRVAWLAVLRAPWCGLSLADLHTLTGADDPAFQKYSISRLMDDRGHLLPDESCQRMTRVWNVLQAVASQRARSTTAQLVERAWRSLGGDAWLNSPQLTNTRRFFQLLDALEAESAFSRIDPVHLDQRLKTLYAEPDPVPPGTPYVELLTIHKAKGLEWDVVILPALERKPAIDQSRLLTWEEIEMPEEDSAHIMLAPIAGRGEESKALNKWINRIRNARDAAERKRLFYVACTRAREELHLFAAPSISAKGEINPAHDSLLNAAWPAAKSHFDLVTTEAGAQGLASETGVSATHLGPFPSESFALDLAAGATSTRLILQRLPLAFDPAARLAAARDQKLPYGEPESDAASARTMFSRPEGSFAARSFGNAVHACLEILAGRIAIGQTPASLLADLPAWTPRIAAILRADGLPRDVVTQRTRETRDALENVLRDPNGLWLLAAHPGAANEFALTAWPDADDIADQPTVRPASVRVDRIFHAGPEPHDPGESHLWIVDYKTTAHGSSSLDEFLTAQRAAYAPQLESYARILAPVRSKSPEEVRLALYFPTLPRLIWWKFVPLQTAS